MKIEFCRKCAELHIILVLFFLIDCNLINRCHYYGPISVGTSILPHVFIPRILTDFLLCAGPCSTHWGTVMTPKSRQVRLREVKRLAQVLDSEFPGSTHSAPVS